MKRAKVVNTKKASIRKSIFDPNDDTDIIGTLSENNILRIDPDVRYYDWTDNEFYKCESNFGEGYIRCELVEILSR